MNLRTIPELIEQLNLTYVINREGKIELHSIRSEPLIKILCTKDRLVRGKALRILEKIGDPKIMKLLIGMLRTDKYPLIRYYGAKALAQIGDQRAVESLIKVLGYKDSWFSYDPYLIYSQWYVAEALGKIGDRRAVKPLIRALKHKHYGRIRSSIVFALGNLGERSAVQPIIHLLKREESSKVRGSCIQALGVLGGEQAVKFLTQARDSEPPELQKVITRALGESRGWWTVESAAPAKGHGKLVDGPGEWITVLEERSSRTLEASVLARREVKCSSCGKAITVESTSCSGCGEPLRRCMVCFGLIGQKEKLAQCPRCDQFAYLAHLLRWVELREVCPHCQQHISPKDITPQT